LLAVENGANIVRAHDVKETVQALRIAAAIEAAR
jgi:dihydropteroate synthase